MSLTPDELGQKIKEAQGRDQPQAVAPPKAMSPEGAKAIRVASDFIAALVVGVFLGYWIDRWLHTTPFGIIIFLFLGFIAGFMNLYRAQQNASAKSKAKDDTDKG